MTVIATAGHVDHGKSSLVQALTGTDPDRWAEEKERGLTIDLGFAQCELPSGLALSLVDVPGHIRFLRNMLAGVGAVQGCLFVVSAVEGWKPQSEEHLRILDLLGISNGIVVITKADLVDDELMELAALEIEDHVAGTFLEGAPVVGVSAHTGSGLNELKAQMDELVAIIGPAPDRGRPRLWVDRSFAPAGAGTVVTGTLVDGSVAESDELIVTPSLAPVRIRSLQSHHQTVETTGPGTRLAVNLTGIAHKEIGRGNALITLGRWHLSRVIDAELSVLADLDHKVSRRGAYSIYIGSGEFNAKVRILGSELLDPGETGMIRIYLREAIPVLPGDRFILRESGRDSTIGGGSFVDIDPQTTASRAAPTSDLDTLIEARGWIEASHLELITGRSVEPSVGQWVVSESALTETKDRVHSLVAKAGHLGLDIASLDDRERLLLDQLDDVTVDAGRAVAGEPPDPLRDHPWISQLDAEPFSPPAPEGLSRDELRQMVRRGLVIEQNGIYFSARSMDQAAQIVSDSIAASESGLTVAEIRDALGTTRKFVLAILGYFDANGMTRRREDLRIAGPRLPDPST